MKKTADGLVIKVKLTPKAARTALNGWTADVDGQPVLKAGVTAVPEKGKANAALIALLAREWGLAKRDILLLHGDTDRNKTLLLKNILTLPAGAGPY